MVSARHAEYAKRNAKLKGARLDNSIVRSGTNAPSISGGKRAGTGIGQAVVKAIREASEATCGNCGGTKDLMQSDRCDQLLCGDCRRLHITAIRRLPHAVKLERFLGIRGMVVPGTHFPTED